jgi:acyl-CoA thioester hydrolase
MGFHPFRATNMNTVKKKYLFETSVKIRDFECDMQGVVNNAYYHNLLEQVRTEFLESIDIDPKTWSRQLGVDFVVYETSIQYRAPLTAGETYRAGLTLSREGARFVFLQEFRSETDNSLCIKARVDVVIAIQERLTRGDYFQDYLDGHLPAPIVHSPIVQTGSKGGVQELDHALFDYELKVRDYECNRFGAATNTFCQHYLEVTRFEFMEQMGATFRQWHEAGIDLMVSKVDLKFIRPMMSSERFHSLMDVRQEGPRLIFSQEIRRKSDGKACVLATVDVVSLRDGALSMGEIFTEFMEQLKKVYAS